MSTPAYDIYLGDVAALQGYRTRSYARDSAPLVASRFSTGQQGQSDLDLLKSHSLDNIAGGMFQRDFSDTQKVARAIGVYNKYDEKLYPTPPPGTATNVSGGYYPTAKAESQAVSFITYGAFSAGTYYNLLYSMTFGGGYANVALPAALQNNGFANISGIALHKKYLFVGSQAQLTGFAANAHRYDITAGTWQDIGGNIQRFFTIRHLLYGINYAGQIYSVTNETAAGAATFTAIVQCGSSNTNNAYITDAVEYNGAAYIAMNEGIYRFDGTNATRILTLSTNQLQVFNGAMYFISGLWLYKFDGTNVTRLQWFGNQEKVGSAYGGNIGLSADNDYLYIATVALTGGYVEIDKFTSGATAFRRIYTYDAVGFLLLNEASVTVGSGYSAGVVTLNGSLYDIFGENSAGWATSWRKWDLTTLFTASAITSSSKLDVTLSEFDDGFPNIYKTLEVIEALYTGIISGDSIAVTYQYYDGKTWSSWIAAGTITSSTGNTIELTNSSHKLFKRLKINFTATLASGSTLAFKGAAIRYTLQPRPRWRWQIGLMAEGNSTINDRLNAAITSDANALSNTVTKSIKQKTPLFMLAPDYGNVKTGINAAALSFIIKGQIALYTDPYNEYPLCAVKNDNGVWEVLRVSAVSYAGGATDETTITVLERGYYGVTAAAISAGAEFHLAYKVYITRLLREATALEHDTYKEQATSGESQIQREFLLEVTEV